MHGHNEILKWASQRFFYGLSFLLILLLTSCATQLQKKDGPPPFNIDETTIPDAKPKAEQLAKSGNMSVYRVNGRSYHVLKTAKNYEERGVASWYGMKFHKQRTSSGEPYDLLAMTAAHKTLPLPTYVAVTNLRNGRKIIVKVNDRGPFRSNRIIDLSYVAAKKLGMTGNGTAYVDVKAIDPNEAFSHQDLWAQNHHRARVLAMSHAHHRLAGKSTHSPVYLQVGTYNKQRATQLKNRLGTVIASPIQVTRFTKKSYHLYRVNIGPIKDVATADTIQKKLRSIGIPSKSIRV